MSQESVDLITRAFEWTYTHDSFEGILPIYHPDLVYHPRADEPDPSPHIGRDAYERLIRGFLEAFSEITFDVLEVIDTGECAIASTLYRPWSPQAVSLAVLPEPRSWTQHWRYAALVSEKLIPPQEDLERELREASDLQKCPRCNTPGQRFLHRCPNCNRRYWSLGASGSVGFPASWAERRNH